jgi:hypothetical protein
MGQPHQQGRDTDQFDFFVSYARKDNETGWITRFVEELLAVAREPHRCLLILDNVDRPNPLYPRRSRGSTATTGCTFSPPRAWVCHDTA